MAKEIKVLYEDINILVIDKPSGISVHADGRSKEKTLVDWILKNYPKMKNVGEPMTLKDSPSGVSGEGLSFAEIKRPGIVHRLDKETSGVLILAKNQKAHEFLKQQFKDRTIKKIYHAIVSGHFKNERGVINKPIGRSPVDFRRHLAGRGARGELREAITEYKVLKNLGKFTYIEVKPKTGRTHQIRVHMKYLNHPVVCDSLYDPNGSCPKELKRLGLHAHSVEFKNLKGQAIKVESPLPLVFKKLLK